MEAGTEFLSFAVPFLLVVGAFRVGGAFRGHRAYDLPGHEPVEPTVDRR